MPTEFLTDAAWIFFAVLSLVIGSISVVAFGPDLLPSEEEGNHPPTLSGSHPNHYD